MNTLETGHGRTRLSFTWQRWGNGLHVHIAGGDHHIGAAALVGKTPSGDTCTGVLVVPPHKEDQMVLRAAHALHDAVGVTVCVTGGVHLDNITWDEISVVLRNADEGVRQLVELLASE
jgi:hypothetical protein